MINPFYLFLKKSFFCFPVSLVFKYIFNRIALNIFSFYPQKKRKLKGRRRRRSGLSFVFVSSRSLSFNSHLNYNRSEVEILSDIPETSEMRNVMDFFFLFYLFPDLTMFRKWQKEMVNGVLWGEASNLYRPTGYVRTLKNDLLQGLWFSFVKIFFGWKKIR